MLWNSFDMYKSWMVNKKHLCANYFLDYFKSDIAFWVGDKKVNFIEALEKINFK